MDDYELNVNCIVNGYELKETLMLKALNENELSEEFMYAWIV